MPKINYLQDGLREVKKEKTPWAGKPGSRMGQKKKKGLSSLCLGLLFIRSSFGQSYNEVLDDDSEGLSSLCLIVMYTFIVASTR
ncbi:hypothetical protein RIR_jg8179.t1 [Rhizophagus irregularis DAOM 181602=DAOM 197198]|nr:hypothetical protein RIR_jg8179.t1 [Rhizophagus irregularis DAOM 181602=DAOM 197198]